MDFTFVSHTIFPNDPKIKEIFFVPHPLVPVDIAFSNGIEVDRGNFNFQFRKYLLKQGYELQRIYVEAPTLNRTIHTLRLTCTNTECPYFDELYKGKCNVKLKASVEVITKRKKSKDSTRHVLVQLKGRDMQETVIKVNCMLDYVFEKTGIEGDPDTYSKTNLC